MDESKLTMTLADAWPILAAMAIGLSVLAWVFQRHIDGRPLIPYAARRPVPWNLLAPLLLLAPTMSAILLAAPGSTPSKEDEPAGQHAVDADPAAPNGVWLAAAVHVAIAAASLAALAAVYGATNEDLGLPRNARELAADVRLGALAFFAALPPIYAVQWLVLLCVDQPTVHPLVKEMLESPSRSMMAGSAILACVGAPLFEEISFRLVFQGWLEQRDNRARLAAIEASASAVAAPPAGADESASPAAHVSATDPPIEADPMETSIVDGEVRWGPILTSALFFGFAHLPHGAAPVMSLMLLGAVLGYVYQRTHRIVPCMICHAMFNGLSMLVFFQMMHVGTE